MALCSFDGEGIETQAGKLTAPEHPAVELTLALRSHGVPWVGWVME